MTTTYILLHQTGAIACSNTLDDSLEGLAAIINPKTLEIFIDGVWQDIPTDIEVLKEADDELAEYEEDEEDEDLITLPLGARRIISPELLWHYCKLKT